MPLYVPASLPYYLALLPHVVSQNRSSNLPSLDHLNSLLHSDSSRSPWLWARRLAEMMSPLPETPTSATDSNGKSLRLLP